MFFKTLSTWSTITACICMSPRGEVMAADDVKNEKPAKILYDGGIAYGTILNHCDGTLLSADDAQSGDLFGHSVTIGPGIAPEGDNMLIGAPSDDNVEGAHAGAVYAFDKINGAWTQIQKLVPASLNPGDYFGCCVDVAGEQAIIGARHADPQGDDSGKVWTAQRLGGFWDLNQTPLMAWDGAAADQFGHAVSTSGDWAIVSAPFKTVNNNLAAGKVYAYRRFGSSWSWHEQFTFPTPQSFTGFGNSLDMMDNTFAAGANFADVAGVYDAGAVLIAEANLVSGNPFFATWGTSLISASDKQVQDHFGSSVALSGQYLYVGAPDRDESGNANAGAVYVFAINGFASYQQVAKIVLPGLWSSPGGQFGKKIAVDGQNIMITDSVGYVYRYWQPDPFVPSAPQLLGKRFKPADAATTYGQSLAMHGADVVVGDLNHAFTPAGGEGAVYVIGAVADDCPDAEAITQGIYTGCTWSATNDGSAGCASSSNSPDVWYKIVGDAVNAGPWLLTMKSDYDSALSVHSGCPGTAANQIACDDDSAGNVDARVHFTVPAGQTCMIRVNGFLNDLGAYELTARKDTCPADISPQPMGDGVVNVNDLLMVISAWGNTAGPADLAPPPNGNFVVNVDELLMVISAWGACP